MSNRVRNISKAKLGTRRKQVVEELLAADQGGMSRKEMGDYILKLRTENKENSKRIDGLIQHAESLRMLLMGVVHVTGLMPLVKEDVKKVYDTHDMKLIDEGDVIVIDVFPLEVESKDAIIEAPVAEVKMV